MWKKSHGVVFHEIFLASLLLAWSSFIEAPKVKVNRECIHIFRSLLAKFGQLQAGQNLAILRQ